MVGNERKNGTYCRREGPAHVVSERRHGCAT